MVTTPPRIPQDAPGPDTAGPDVSAAYQLCERITAEQARNFSYGIRLLPPDKRAALSAVYAFARRMDDIGDEPGTSIEGKLAGLAEAREQIAAPERFPGDPVLVALADAARRFPIPLAAFGELIEGVELDVRGAAGGVAIATLAELEHYCRCVAGAIGRLSLGVFTATDLPAASHLADRLGLALQLTNILRDVREDLAGGRIYLPAEDLDRYGVRLELGPHGELAVPSGSLTRLVRFEVARAESWYAEGLRLLPMLDHRSAACCAAMAGIYHRLLHRIAAEPVRIATERVSLTAGQKLLVAARALARGTA